MAGRSNRHGDSSDSPSPDPRSKRRPDRSRPPSASPPKRSRKSEQQRARERPRELEKTRDSSEHYKRGRTDRTDVEFDEEHRRDNRNAERERERERDREREKERLRDKERERDRERHRDRHVERMGREKERENDRDRDSGKRDRRPEKETIRDKQEHVDMDKDRDRNISRNTRDGEKERPKETQGKERRSFPTPGGGSDSPEKPNREISPDRAGKETAVATRDEASKHYEEDHSLDGPEDSLAKMRAAEAEIEEKHKAKEIKEKPSFEYSGKLAAETNRVRGVTLLFNEPPEARKPTVRWRLYIFKDGEPLNEPLYIHRLSCYLFGRERRVADVPTDHPSCSKQHAVIQYRLVEREEEDGSLKSEVRPYLMDLGSTNGTFLNGERIESQRYYELFEKDTIKFGNSSREYVLLHENSAG